MSKVAFLTIFILMVAGCATKHRLVDRKPPLEGTYVAVAATVNGRDVPPEVINVLRLTMTHNTYKTERGNEVLFDSTYLIDTSAKPHHINMLGTEGPAAGKEALGIYSLEGDYLRICYVMPGKPRPATFASAPGSEASLVVWRRAGK